MPPKCGFFIPAYQQRFIRGVFAMPINRKESHHDAIIAIGLRHHVRLLPD